MSNMPDVFKKHVGEQTIPAVVQDEVRAALDRYLAQFRSRYAAYRAASDPTKSALLGGHLLNDYQQGQWQVLARHAQAGA
jgi:hypothetical protein